MNGMIKQIVAALILASSLVLSGCGGSDPTASSGNISIGTVGEEFKFDADGITLKAGTPVQITFKNNSTNSQHNWVLVKGGEEVAAQVNEAGLIADAGKGYVPDDPNVLAHSKLLEGGQGETFMFNVPAAGTYIYLCTFPGHYASGMKGVLVVQP